MPSGEPILPKASVARRRMSELRSSRRVRTSPPPRDRSSSSIIRRTYFSLRLSRPRSADAQPVTSQAVIRRRKDSLICGKDYIPKSGSVVARHDGFKTTEWSARSRMRFSNTRYPIPGPVGTAMVPSPRTSTGGSMSSSLK